MGCRKTHGLWDTLYSKWSHWIRQSQSDKSALRRSPFTHSNISLVGSSRAMMSQKSATVRNHWVAHTHKLHACASPAVRTCCCSLRPRHVDFFFNPLLPFLYSLPSRQGTSATGLIVIRFPIPPILCGASGRGKGLVECFINVLQAVGPILHLPCCHNLKGNSPESIQLNLFLDLTPHLWY